MPTQTFAAVNPRYFLNRLALEHSTDSMLLDPVEILKHLFTARSYPDMAEMFEDFCEAAVAPAFCWTKSPATLLSFTEELEQLIEACYLLYRNRKANSPADLKPLKTFFHAFSLPEWKRILREWMRAAMSDRSIAELGEPREMIPFVRGMEELIKVAGNFIHEE